MSAANVHVQPGLANALSGILNAARARVPMLVTVGQQVRSMLPGAPFLGGELVAMAAPVAKGAWEAERAEDLPRLLARAVRVARTPPCGPVVLSIPMDLQVAQAPDAHPPSPGEAAPAPDPAAIARAAALLGGARAPVILLGDGVVHAHASGAAAAVAERLGAPIMGEPFAARAPLATDHPLWRGPLPGFAAEIHPLLAGHDVVLAAGMPVFRLFGASEGPALPEGVALVHLDVDAEEVGRVHRPAVGIVAHPGLALEGLLAALGPEDEASRARRGRAEAETAALRRRRRAALARGSDGAISPQSFSRAVAAVAAPRDLVVDEALTSGRHLRAVLSVRRPCTWLAHRGSALGWSAPPWRIRPAA
jgi:benzoylformate decarboxylase